MLRCRYAIVPWPEDERPEILRGALVIRDLGRRTMCTVTNDAEEVVRRLIDEGELEEDQRLFYFDSEDKLDEIRHKDGRFTEFHLGPSELDGAWKRYADG